MTASRSTRRGTRSCTPSPIRSRRWLLRLRLRKRSPQAPSKVRMGLHTGELQLTGEGYAGRELHKAARIAASGHGGQVVVSAATRALIDGELTELGEHRLKDFDEPVPLFQLGSERFPAAEDDLEHEPSATRVLLRRQSARAGGATRSASERLAPRHPLRSGRFGQDAARARGRLRARARVQSGRLLGRPVRAARPRARDADDRADARGEGRPRRARRRPRAPAPARQLRAGGRGRARALAAARGLPEPELLVTSRELLRITGEVEYPVPPLAEPEAVELFCERARLEPDETIAALCRQLDELPLALELAAARTSVLSPAQILDRLGQRLDLFKGGRDADPRQQTLRATIEWSHDLLTEDEQSSSPASPSSPAAAPSTPPKTSATPTSTSSSRSSTRACCATRATASGCWRPSANSPPSASMDGWRAARSSSDMHSGTWAWRRAP